MNKEKLAYVGYYENDEIKYVMQEANIILENGDILECEPVLDPHDEYIDIVAKPIGVERTKLVGRMILKGDNYETEDDDVIEIPGKMGRKKVTVIIPKDGTEPFLVNNRKHIIPNLKPILTQNMEKKKKSKIC
jgi:hypothetical protein